MLLLRDQIWFMVPNAAQIAYLWLMKTYRWVRGLYTLEKMLFFLLWQFLDGLFVLPSETITFFFRFLFRFQGLFVENMQQNAIVNTLLRLNKGDSSLVVVLFFKLM